MGGTTAGSLAGLALTTGFLAINLSLFDVATRPLRRFTRSRRLPIRRTIRRRI